MPDALQTRRWSAAHNLTSTVASAVHVIPVAIKALQGWAWRSGDLHLTYRAGAEVGKGQPFWATVGPRRLRMPPQRLQQVAMYLCHVS